MACLLVIIDQPRRCHAKGFFGKLIGMAKRENEKGDTANNNTNNNRRSANNEYYSGDFPTTKLWNGVHFPLVGLGVGNMEPEVVSAIISHGLRDNKHIRLIDTAHVSQNEDLVAKGIVEGVEQLLKDTSDQEPVEVHVITKVWYTHLGYQRTLASAKSSLDSLKEAIDHPKVDVKVHIMLHWPRCYNEIPWMGCQAEEDELPDAIKKAGPPPHLNPDTAWKESWKALEELLKDKNNPIASIGVSNFQKRQLEELSSIATVAPHVVETNTWSLLYDPLLIEFCHKQGIHIVAHNLMEGVIHQSQDAPFASHHLLSVAHDMSKAMRAKGLLSEESRDLTDVQVVLAWLVQHSISIIPRTTDLYHLQENSAVSLQKIPPMDDSQVEIVAQSVEALISGEDLTEDAFVTVTFHAKSKDVFLYWHDPEFGGEIEVARIEKGKSFQESSHPGHTFKIYDVEGSAMELFKVVGNYGEHTHIEL